MGYDAILIPCYQFFFVKINLNKIPMYVSKVSLDLYYPLNESPLNLFGFNFLAYDKVTGKL